MMKFHILLPFYFLNVLYFLFFVLLFFFSTGFNGTNISFSCFSSDGSDGFSIGFFIILLVFGSAGKLSVFNNSILPPVGSPNLNDSGSFGGTCVSECTFNSEGSFLNMNVGFNWKLSDFLNPGNDNCGTNFGVDGADGLADEKPDCD